MDSEGDLANSIRQARPKSSVRLPWETPSLQWLRAELWPGQWLGPKVSAPPPPLPNPPRASSIAMVPQAAPYASPKTGWGPPLKKIKWDFATTEEDTASKRVSAIEKWRIITKELGVHCGCVQSLGLGPALESMRYILAKKRTATLQKRAGAWLRYVAWCRERTFPVGPLAEPQVFCVPAAPTGNQYAYGPLGLA